ncbi:MAG: hypothetical protein LQ346_005766 [Caloplaca aetnensis]|nr:MAG: hypothetical protein LQ346_005766 [Caloplaca aetnensis]
MFDSQAGIQDSHDRPTAVPTVTNTRISIFGNGNKGTNDTSTGQVLVVDSSSTGARGEAEDKTELTEVDAYGELGFCFSTSRKWLILSIIFVVQCSMNFNASVYGNATSGLMEEFKISGQMSRVGQAVFLIAYAFGCELWAPWSEEFGRRTVLQLSLFFVNLWQIPCALAPNYTTILVGRTLGGLSSAGGSVTLGLVADMWEPDDQQYAVAFVVLSSVGGSVLGPVIGAFIEKYQTWQWVFWWQLIFGVATQLLHIFFVPETRATILLDREARRLRESGEKEVYGPNEMKSTRITPKEVLAIWYRPFEMFVREPIVLFLSLLSGFSDALIFTFLVSYGPVFQQWDFGAISTGLAFIPLLIGYFIAYFSFLPGIRRQCVMRKSKPDSLQPEARLYWLLWTAPLETIGLFGFAWTSLGPPAVHWIAPLIFSTMIAIANYAIYMATIDYMIASYGPYSASATGGNGLARDFLAGVAAMYSMPFYQNIPAFGKYHLVWPTFILACLAGLVTVPIFVFYYKGPEIRARSKFAQSLASDRRAQGDARRSARNSVVQLPEPQAANKDA